MSPLADRRGRVRSEVGGRLRGILEIADAPARVMNISNNGALIETSMPTPVGSLRPLHLTIEGQSVRVKTCVRRLTKVGQGTESQYAIGAEFVSPSEGLSVLVARLIAEAELD